MCVGVIFVVEWLLYQEYRENLDLDRLRSFCSFLFTSANILAKIDA